MNHKEKQEIFDKYAETQGFEDWNDLKNCCIEFDINIDEHIFIACDLVQKEQQKRIADRARIEKIEDAPMPSMTTYTVDKHSITNPENLIK